MTTLRQATRMTATAAMMIRAIDLPVSRYTILKKVFSLQRDTVKLSEHGRYDAWGEMEIRHNMIRIDIQGLDDIYTIFTPSQIIKTRSRRRFIDTIHKMLRG